MQVTMSLGQGKTNTLISLVKYHLAQEKYHAQ